MDTTTEGKEVAIITTKPTLPAIKEPSFSFGDFTPEETRSFTEILKKDPHIKFLEKRNLVIPKVTDEKVVDIFGTNEGVKVAIGYIKDFMQAVPIADDFTNHREGRNGWRKVMLETHGRRFFDFYNLYNQLRICNLQSPLGYTEFLSRLAHSEKYNPFFERLKRTHAELMSAITGHPVSVEITDGDQDKVLTIDAKSQLGDAKDYDSRDLEGRLKVVHFFEDKVLDILKEISGEQQK